MDARTAIKRRRHMAQLAAQAGPSRRVNVTIKLRSSRIRKSHTYQYKVPAHRNPENHQIRGDLIMKSIERFRRDFGITVSKYQRPQLESYTVLD